MFNKKQILTILLCAGPFAAGLLLSENNRIKGQSTVLYKISGFVITLLSYAIALFIIEQTIVERGLLNEHMGLINPYAVGILFSMQLITGLVLVPFLLSFQVITYDEVGHASIAKLIPYLLTGLGLSAFLIAFGPFRFFFLLLYMVPHYYMYHRTAKAFTNKRIKKGITLVLIFFMLLFPVIEIIYNFHNNVWIRTGLMVSYFYLPFILHYFMIMVTYDIIMFLLTNVHVLNKKVVYNPTNWKKTLSLMVILSVVIVVYAHINFNSPSYTSYYLEIPSQSSNKNKMKVVVASDFHFAEITRSGFVRRFVDKVNAIEPDLVLFPGDIVESDNENGQMDRIAIELKKIKSRYGVYGSLGNHEYYGDLGKNIRFCEKAGIKMLSDTAIIIDGHFIVLGQNDIHDPDRKNLYEIRQTVNQNLPTILMRHRPIDFEDAVNNKIDLMVSGHTHHGQLFPFQLLTMSFYELSWGHDKVKGTHFITTSGAQGWGPQTRTTGKSEIVVVHVNFI